MKPKTTDPAIIKDTREMTTEESSSEDKYDEHGRQKILLKEHKAEDIKTTPRDDNVTWSQAANSQEVKDGGLSTGERTGIAMGCIVVFWIILGPLVCLICKLRDKKRHEKEKEARNEREKVSTGLVEEMVKAELQKMPNGDKEKQYQADLHDDHEIEPITIGDSESVPYIDADASSRDTAL